MPDEAAPPSRLDLRGDLRIVHRSIGELIPYAKNARTHSDQQVAQIAASMTEFGWTNPILIDEAGGIIAGHGRVLAAAHLQIASDLPCLILTGLTPQQKQALVITDNKLALNAGWDIDLLLGELGEIAENGFDLGTLGWNEDEMAALLGGSAPGEGLTDPDDIPSTPVDPVSELGDVWILGKHRIVCGDCTDALAVAKALNGVEPHLMVTDPPYGVNYDPSWRNGLDKVKRAQGKVKNDERPDWREAYALFPGDVAYIWHAPQQADVLHEGMGECGFALRAQIIWVKPHFAIGRGDYHVQHEPCSYLVKKTAKGHWNGSRKESTIWQIANGTFQGGVAKAEDAKTGHGTQKPVECMRRPVENNSSPGQAVYEPFSGSGTTIIACEMTGRACHSLELSPAYVDVAIQRWQNFTGRQAVLEGAGETYAQVELNRRRKAA